MSVSDNFFDQVYVPYDYNTYKNFAPPVANRILNLVGAPAAGNYHVLLLTDGIHTIEELFQQFLQDRTVNFGILYAGLTAEISDRQGADLILQQQIDLLKQNAGVALVFTDIDEAVLWATGTDAAPTPNPSNFYPSMLKVGTEAYFTTPSPSAWWDGTQWRLQENQIDLSGYLTVSNALNYFAPLESPHFIGTPTAPIPDYDTAPDDQIEVVGNTRDTALMIEALMTLFFMHTEIDTDTGHAIFMIDERQANSGTARYIAVERSALPSG